MADGMGFDTRWELLFEDAWDDPELKQRLLTDANTVLKERGIKIPEGQEIRFVENTPTVEYLILPSPPAQDELADEQLEAVAGGGCPSSCGGGGGCGGGGACGGGGGCGGCSGSRGCLSSRGCRSCRGSRGSRNCRP